MDSTKKLSKLQKQILALALANRIAEGRDQPYVHVPSFIDGLLQRDNPHHQQPTSHGGCDLARNQILHEVYNFPTALEGELATDGWDMGSLRRRDGSRILTGKMFDVEEIGRERYDAAQAAVSRAIVRLEQRGLVERIFGAYSHWAGVNLTDAGVELAQTVKSWANLPAT
jgi:hypothetical protein